MVLSWSSIGRRMALCRLLAIAITASLLRVFLLSPSVASTRTPYDTGRSGSGLTERSSEGAWESVETSHLRFDKAPVLDAATKGHSYQSHEHGRSGFEQDVLDLNIFIEDEIRSNGLLSSLPLNGGNTLLRELSLRVRVFKSAFEAWENIHLVQYQGLSQHQNVIQRLRKQADSNLRKSVATYDSFRNFVNRLAERLFPFLTPFYGDLISLHTSYAGRGLVFTAGDKQAPYLLTSIPGMRRLGCSLPIEIMYLGETDLSEDMRDKLEELPGVTTRDMSQMVDDDGWTLKGWAAKPWAILLSSFKEAIFIDADALFLINPERMFFEEAYVDTGALFFTDRRMFPESKRNWLQNILPKPISAHIKTNRLWTGESGHMQDSGVVVVDKWRHFVALLLACRLNGPDRDGDKDQGKKGVYEMVYGDKETFWLSWEMAGDLDYAFHDGAVGSMKVAKAPKSGHSTLSDSLEHIPMLKKLHGSDQEVEEFCSPQLLHLDHGRPIWFNGWIAAGKFEGSHLFESFDSYTVEPDGVQAPWKLKKGNVACLQNDESYEFTAEENMILEDLLKAARDNHTGRNP